MYLVGDIFVSEILKKPVLDRAGEEIGKIKDFLIKTGEIFPWISSILITSKKMGPALIPWEDINLFNRRIISVKNLATEIIRQEVSDDDLLICRDILDKQIVDIDGVKVVRVNDIKLEEIENNLCLIAIDVGLNGILRRLSIEQGAKGLWKLFGYTLTSKLISWDYLQSLEPKLTKLTLKVSRKKISELHPADIAHIISQVPLKEKTVLFDSLDPEMAAEALHELEPKTQANIIEGMDKEQATDILERMPPDEAADVLGDLPEAKAQELLNLMEEEEAEDVQELLEHDDDTAGGLMTTEYLGFTPDMTVEEAFTNLRLMLPDVELIYYIYIIDDDEHLLGVLSLKDLIMSNPQKNIAEIMRTKIKTVTPETDQMEVAELISKYNLYAVPVVDKEKKLLGIVTIDDIVDLVLPPSSRKKRQRA